MPILSFPFKVKDFNEFCKKYGELLGHAKVFASVNYIQTSSLK
jgi:hypothetical protein